MSSINIHEESCVLPAEDTSAQVSVTSAAGIGLVVALIFMVVLMAIVIAILVIINKHKKVKPAKEPGINTHNKNLQFLLCC